MTFTEIKNMLENLGVEKVKVSPSGEQVVGLCPLHTENRRSFGVSVEKLLFNCYGCKESGTLVTLVMKLRKCSKEEALQFIERFGAYESEKDSVIQFFPSANLRQAEAALESLYAPYLSHKNIIEAKKYARERGIVYSKLGTLTKTKHALGYDPEKRRILFPWWDDNKFLGCNGRIVYKDRFEAKTIQYFGLNKSKHLFPGHMEWKSYKGFRALAIVEGEIDAIRVSQLFSHTNIMALALGNSEATGTQIVKLKQIGGPFVIGLDNDKPGILGAAQLHKQLARSRLVATRVDWPQKDPGACSDREIVETLKNMGWIGI